MEVRETGVSCWRRVLNRPTAPPVAGAKSLTVLSTVLVSTVLPIGAFAEDAPQVHCAGFAYIWDDATIATSFAYSRAIAQGKYNRADR